jgi:hypothetical protein
MVITTTVDNVLFLEHNGGLRIKLINPDVAGILEQIKSVAPADPATAKLVAVKSKGESVAEVATANLEAAMARTFPIGKMKGFLV